jgi:60 kDa SS-A/Ro ribonucleoprotein
MFNLPWEVLPSELLNVPAVWHGMLPNMGIGALVRNLGRLTANGTITPMSGVENLIVARLSNEGQIRRSRIHPYSVLLGAVTYAQGRGFKGSLSWQPNGKILSALDSTFGLAFKNVEPSGKRTLVGLDVSGSMDGSRIAGSFLTAREASSAMALVTLAVEPWTATMAFSGGFVPINLHAGQSLADVVRSTRNMPFDRTDCSAPFRWATQTKTDVETFVIYTDSEVNVGTHPAAALREYRQRIGHDVKLVVVGMTANRFSIADPNDAGMLDVVGFDASAPALISDFSAGKV